MGLETEVEQLLDWEGIGKPSVRGSFTCLPLHYPLPSPSSQYNWEGYPQQGIAHRNLRYRLIAGYKRGLGLNAVGFCPVYKVMTWTKVGQQRYKK